MNSELVTSTFLLARDFVESTPALVIDQAIASKNNQKLVEYARQHGIGVRPHTKTHKTLQFGRMQIEQGCVGLTAAKVGEAEKMAQVSNDILLAYPVVDSVRAGRLARLAGDVTLRVAADSIECIDVLASAAAEAKTTIGVLVDLDVGMHRTGVETPELTLELANRVVSHSPHLRLDGLFIYPGHVAMSVTEQIQPLNDIEQKLAETIALWKSNGLTVSIVSGGSTPTAYQSHHIPSVTEIRPGTHIFNDMNTVRGGFCSEQDLAAAVICTVVSTAVSGKAVIDGGSKTFTSDRNAKDPDSGFGLVLEYPEAKIVRLTEEHGELDLSACSRRPKVGDRVTVIPNHICPCVNLHERLWLQTEPGKLEAVFVDARGLLV